MSFTALLTMAFQAPQPFSPPGENIQPVSNLSNNAGKGAARKASKILRVMKLTTLLLLGACLQISAAGFSQRVTLSEKNTRLADVFAKIERQTGYSFTYTESLLRQASPVTITIRDMALEEALNQCFKNQPLEYTIIEKTIVVKQKPVNSPVLLSPVEGPVEAPPPVDIKGRIINDLGEPVRASITVKGTQTGTTSDASGFFELKGIDPSATLLISATNIETLSIPAAVILSGVEGPNISFRSGTATITARIKISALNEVIVNKGYYTEKQKYSVGNVGRVTAKDIEKQPVNNPLLALQGRVPGLQITQVNGIPGGTVAIRIQGRNTLGTATNPLIVIDGIPYPSELPNTNKDNILSGVLPGASEARTYGNPLNYINPADIESIEILKDADATAIYGSQAANGAILITRKKGIVGQPKLTVNLQQGWGKVTRMADMLNRRQYLDMRYEALRNDGILLSSLASTNSQFYDLKVWDTTRSTDWQKELIGKTAHYTNLNVSFTGGTEISSYTIGTTFRRTTTVFPGDFDNKAYSLHFAINSSTKNNKFKAQFSGSYNYDNNHLPGVNLTERAVLLEPVAPALYNLDGTLNWGTNPAGSSTWTNPMVYKLFADYSNISKSLVSNLRLRYQIIPDLEIQANVGYNILNTYRYLPSPLMALPPEQRSTGTRFASYGYTDQDIYRIDPQAIYNKSFGKHRIESNLGITYQQNTTNILALQGSGYNSDLVLRHISSAVSVAAQIAGNSKYRYVAVFGRLNYILNDKYVVNITGRRDGSSRFGEYNKFHTFGSLGGAWLFGDEKFVRNNLPFLSFGKLKASYGTTGNDAISDYSHLELYTVSSNGIPYQNAIGLVNFRLPNPYMEWEETKKFMMGMDLGFLDDKISISASYILNRSSNQVTNFELPLITGFPGIETNSPALIENRNWELELTVNPVNKSDFDWKCSFNFTVPQNKLVSFPGIEKTPYADGTRGIIIGQPVGVIKTYTTAGVDPATGNYIILDKYGNPGSINSLKFPDDYNKLIDVTPRFYGGLVNRISFKGLELDFLFQFTKQLGLQDLNYYNGRRNPGRFAGSGSGNQSVDVLDRWTKPGDIASIGRFNTTGSIIPPTNNYSYDASYKRLKNVSLSYNVPKKIISRFKLQSGQFYFHAQNLITITKYSGIDPETRVITNLPPLALFTTGFKMVL